MATLTLEYNTRNIQARKTLEYILSMGFFKVVKTEKISEVEKALQEVKKGKINTYNSVDDLLKKINN